MATGGLWQTYLSRRYALLFYSLLLTLATGPVLGVLGWRVGLVFEFLLIANIFAAVIPMKDARLRKLLLILMALAGMLRWGASWLGFPALSAESLALGIVVALAAIASALHFALRATAVDSEHVYAALSAYLLAGMVFGLLYWVLERTWPGSLYLGVQGADSQLWLEDAIYFSFVTLATLGYGDIVPRSEAARGLAILEAVAGQLYLAVMIARLVSLYVRGREREPQERS